MRVITSRGLMVAASQWLSSKCGATQLAQGDVAEWEGACFASRFLQVRFLSSPPVSCPDTASNRECHTDRPVVVLLNPNMGFRRYLQEEWAANDAGVAPRRSASLVRMRVAVRFRSPAPRGYSSMVELVASNH